MLAILGMALALCIVSWFFALWLTGAKVDYRTDANSGLIALSLAPEAGLSFQWSEQGYSAWAWSPNGNRRLWPEE